ncbi:MAG: 50S ribosomal protein L30 [Candidatus Lambdaproteobacteria bacterium RIFOXYD1_FULL_56_27]|uniref:Large ribosomal subunit protein uL30 n=1 Tax=Candidatus Lambdaproteobacteria bacterium RIFOXYD2_FULL_56_26 TaxID=1817773 RepID=A0A1F6GMN8_9PROT|nr:MAG: 50S ribosomal protein L30 [Candidatus Lambdaproteobacteria bacterium RIFOXYD2_FULL_56_26]OGH05627.1 MAG: 50S ribosomal protein L30 [Candidatus Lambdaproteobacteria bacterium RIFOXYC1_FULL_56_13]OGH08587.1 MAG: 50S ribosomal protein L30 [Candidatus Lambdaproteobacteria bacterium RIFOXYD1_FULL_56_27]
MSGQLKVTLRKSRENSSKKQQEHLKGLGLRKIRQERILKDTPEIRGMIAKVSHMVEVETL